MQSNVRWLFDATVDAVEIKKLICQPIFFAFLPLTTLTIKSYSNPQFFFLLCCWHHWHLKKHKCVNQNFKSTFRWLSDAAIDTVDIKKLICQQIFFFVFLRLTPLTSKVHSHPNFFFSTLPLTPLTFEKTWIFQRKSSKGL